MPEEEYLIPFGQARIAREGTDVTVVAIAGMVNRALAAADTLAGEGISVEVIDPRTLVPLDIETILASVHKTGRLLVVDEDYSPCGVAAEIGMQVMERGFDDLDAPVARLTGAQAPGAVQRAAGSGDRPEPADHRPGDPRSAGSVGRSEDRGSGLRSFGAECLGPRTANSRRYAWR